MIKRGHRLSHQASYQESDVSYYRMANARAPPTQAMPITIQVT